MQLNEKQRQILEANPTLQKVRAQIETAPEGYRDELWEMLASVCDRIGDYLGAVERHESAQRRASDDPTLRQELMNASAIRRSVHDALIASLNRLLAAMYQARLDVGWAYDVDPSVQLNPPRWIEEGDWGPPPWEEHSEWSPAFADRHAVRGWVFRHHRRNPTPGK